MNIVAYHHPQDGTICPSCAAHMGYEFQGEELQPIYDFEDLDHSRCLDNRAVYCAFFRPSDPDPECDQEIEGPDAQYAQAFAIIKDQILFYLDAENNRYCVDCGPDEIEARKKLTPVKLSPEGVEDIRSEPHPNCVHCEDFLLYPAWHLVRRFKRDWGLFLKGFSSPDTDLTPWLAYPVFANAQDPTENWED